MCEILVSVDTGKRIYCPVCGQELELRHRTKGNKVMKHEVVKI